MFSQYRILSRLISSSYTKCILPTTRANISVTAIRNSDTNPKLQEIHEGQHKLDTVVDSNSNKKEEASSLSVSSLTEEIEIVKTLGHDHIKSRQDAQRELENSFTPFRYVYPEFLPNPALKYRNRVREKLERMDMLNRRRQIDIPEFYVGSVLSVTTSDPNAPGKTSTFVGICIQRDKTGLATNFTLRNIVDGMGIEVCYEQYNPTIQNITCLRLEKRLDDNLRYLRDAPPEYSTFPFDMAPEMRNADAPVPVNPLKVKLKAKPWSTKWHLWDLKGIEDISGELADWELKRMNTWKRTTGYEVKDFDLMKTYRSTIPVEEQVEIYSEFAPQLSHLSQSMKKQKRKRTFAKPQKTA